MKRRLILRIASIFTVFFGIISTNAAEMMDPCDPEIFTADSTNLQTSDCLIDAKFCINVPFADQPNYQYLVDGNVYAGVFSGCNFDTISAFTYATLFGMGNSGPYLLDSWTVSGNTFFGITFQDIPELVTFMNSVDPNGNWVDDPASSLIVGGDSNNTYSSMDVTVLSINSPSFIGYNFGLEAQGTLIDLPVGSHQIIAVDIPNVCSDTIMVNVACISPEYYTDQIFVGQSDTFCLNFTELAGPPTSITDYCPAAADGDVGFSFIFSNTCIAYSGNAVGQDSFCIVACDDFGFCDTTVMFIEVLNLPGSGPNIVYDTLMVNQVDILCLDTMSVGTGPFTANNFCPQSSGTYANITIDPVSYCVFYQGLTSTGTDSLCVEVCGSTGCDTTYLIVTVIPDPTIESIHYDTLYVNQNSSFCPDQSDLPGNIVGISNICPTSGGQSAMFVGNPLTFCMDYNTVELGKDTACVVLEDDLGNFDTTTLIVCVLSVTPEVIYDTLFLGNTATYCVDTTELSGTITSIDDFCNTLSGNSVDFQINAINLCVDGTTVDLGTDTSCIVICDNFGVCDSTTFIVTVLDPSFSPPVAFDDVDSTSQNQPIGINYCGNDVIPNNDLVSFELLDIADGGVGPVNGGSVIFNNDCTLSYVPLTGFCGGVDSFSYVICNAVGCDTAVVAIYVECPAGSGDFMIHNAFSPNGDSVNEHFQIDGIGDFNDHLLCIYNRWGNQVYRTENYQNDWEGTWEGNDLPTGTYFYVFDDGEGNNHTGWVQIMR